MSAEGSRLSLDLLDAEADLYALVSIAPVGDGVAEALAVVLGPADQASVIVESSAALERESGGSLLRAAGIELEDRGEEGIAARLHTDGARLDVEARLTAPPARIDRDQEAGVLVGASREVTPAHVAGAVEIGETGHSVDAPGHRVRTTGAIGWDRLAALGVLHATLRDGGLLCALAARPRTAAGHGDEAVSAAMQAPDGTLEPMRSALLSTQYDAEGRQQRATLELEAEQPAAEDPEPDPEQGEEEAAVRLIRGAGTLLRGARLELPGRRAEVGFFGWSVEGVSGIGRYDRVWRS